METDCPLTVAEMVCSVEVSCANRPRAETAEMISANAVKVMIRNICILSDVPDRQELDVTVL